jgi:hypothetical protein
VNSYVPLPGSRLYDSMSDTEKGDIDWGKVAYKSFDNYFSKIVSRDDLRRYLSEAYDIADSVRKRTLLRFQSTIGVSQQ